MTIYVSNDDLLSYPERVEDTGLVDRSGMPILTGDIVEYYFGESIGVSNDRVVGGTRMRDLVKYIEGGLYFVCSYGGASAHRFVDYCKVIGTDPSLIDT